MTTDLNSNEQVDFSNDSIVIVKNIETIPGGKTLDCTGYAPAFLKAGHIIIEEDATGNLLPLPVDDTLPALHSYKGVLVASILTAQPIASIMVRGTVDTAAMEYPADATAIAALPLIRFS